MASAQELFYQLSSEHQRTHNDRKMIMSFWDYLDLVKQNSHQFLRHSSAYLTEMFDYYGNHPTDKLCATEHKSRLFEISTAQRNEVIGGERPQKQILDTLQSFVTHGHSFKLLLLCGPNGSSKSTTVASITGAMEDYSHTDQGALYTFSWVFSQDKTLISHALDPSTVIGFSDSSQILDHREFPSLAGLEESKVSSKINSEFRENPIYLLPMPLRETFCQQIQNTDKGDDSENSNIPDHIFLNGLSKKNNDIFDHLLAAYKGDLREVFRHVQVERFYLSRHYRQGIATVEPQMSVDASEHQVTMDQYLKNLPTVLQTISFFNYSGALVNGNRGLIEFSDFLKRPIETFKYLLNTIEHRSVQLSSATALLDTVFIATTNDKHWEAFSQIPDFHSFRGRIQLITVPYLLEVHQEMRIYEQDCERLSKHVTIAPYALKILCLFAVMTRLRPPRSEPFGSDHTSALKALTPLIKAYLYNNDLHHHQHNRLENSIQKYLISITPALKEQYIHEAHYEGKYGASPRFVRDILHSAAQSASDQHLSAVEILTALDHIICRDDLYEFLRLKPVGGYHQPKEFVHQLRKEYQSLFEQELLDSMAMAESHQYKKLLSDYIDHVVCAMRQEKIYDSARNTYQEPDETMMSKMEKIIGITDHPRKYRESLLARMGSYKIDNPNTSLDLEIVFDDIVQKIKHNFYISQKSKITSLCKQILQSHLTNQPTSPEVQRTLYHLKSQYGYHQITAIKSLQFCFASSSSKLMSSS